MCMINKVIKVDYLTRVEGEGSIYVKVKDGEVSEVKFKVFEPPRFFEAFLRGRKYSETPDITARICGICPIAYQMSAVYAIEDAFDVIVDGQLRELRRLMYCGEWIESHALHIYMLHAPDFLGCQDVFQVAKEHPAVVKRALEIKKIGNEIVSILGGREIHPVNGRVGGFYRVPSKKELEPLITKLVWARDASAEALRWTTTLQFPDFEDDYEFVSLRHPAEYPMIEGRLVSNKGLDIAIREYEFQFEEEHAPHSNALQSYLKGRGNYFVGPLARFNLNFDRLSPMAQRVAQELGFVPPVQNPFKSIIARSVELLYAFEEALRIVQSYIPPEHPSVAVRPKGGFGFGCTEAPRGILYHRYRVSEDGRIQDAKIVPPTSQNQRTMESDLRKFVTKNIDLPKEDLTWKCEQAVRNYDPCISCATHLVTLEVL
jgi:sulfhydrogenase subunit alpha